MFCRSLVINEIQNHHKMLFRSMTPRLGRLVLTPPASLALSLPPSRFAGSKAGGSTKNGRDSAPKFLGVKLPGGARVEPGNVIVRQRGQRVGLVAATRTVAFGRDWTVFALQPGVVKYWRDGARGGKSVVEVVRAPSAAAAPGTLEAPDSSALGATSGRTSVERRVSTSAVERYPLVLVRFRACLAMRQAHCVTDLVPPSGRRTVCRIRHAASAALSFIQDDVTTTTYHHLPRFRLRSPLARSFLRSSRGSSRASRARLTAPWPRVSPRPLCPRALQRVSQIGAWETRARGVVVVSRSLCDATRRRRMWMQLPRKALATSRLVSSRERRHLTIIDFFRYSLASLSCR